MTAQEWPRDLPDLRMYERMIDDGIAAANARGGVVDHLTARRLAIWLAARPQTPEFARGLVRFVRTGAITHSMKSQLRLHTRSGLYPQLPEASRLMEYCIARGTDRGPIGMDFGKTCDEIDRADVVLAGLRERVRQRQGLPEPTWPDTDGPQVIAQARRDPQSRTVSLIMDAATANITMYAVAAYAGDREAHVREVEQSGENLPEDSYGRRNRQAIAAREARVAARLRAVEHAYRTAIERDHGAESEPVRTIHPAEHVATMRWNSSRRRRVPLTRHFSLHVPSETPDARSG
jgi:hypothetical protein